MQRQRKNIRRSYYIGYTGRKWLGSADPFYAHEYPIFPNLIVDVDNNATYRDQILHSYPFMHAYNKTFFSANYVGRSMIIKQIDRYTIGVLTEDLKTLAITTMIILFATIMKNNFLV